MRQEVNVEYRKDFVAESIGFAQKRLDERDEESPPSVAILNGAVQCGKELVALAFYAACTGQDSIPKDWEADELLFHDQGNPVVFHNFTDAVCSETDFRRSVQMLSAQWSFAQFIVLSNLKTRVLNQFRLSGAGQLPEGIDCHVNVTRARNSVDGDWKRKLVFDVRESSLG